MLQIILSIAAFILIAGVISQSASWLKQYSIKRWDRYLQTRSDKRFVKWQMSQRYTEPVTFSGMDTSEYERYNPYELLHSEYVWADEVHGDMRN